MSKSTVRLGYAIPSGDEVLIPFGHLAVTGQTQASGKTTTLEALITRSRRKAIAFITKRAEGAFREGHRITPYFRERADWKFVSSILEATQRERMKFERSWIMRACKGAKTLEDVQENVQAAMTKAKGLSADVYLALNEYLSDVIPQVRNLAYAKSLDLQSGLNLMDLSEYTTDVQGLVIRSVLEWVYQRGRDIIVVIPEAWEFLPLRRSSPVLLAAEELIRKGGSAGNFIWLDSQDLSGVNAFIRKQIHVWILGVQREINEVKRTLAHVYGVQRKPKADEIASLERGQFVACFGQHAIKTYVQPVWLDESEAREVAMGAASPRAAPVVSSSPILDDDTQVVHKQTRAASKRKQKEIIVNEPDDESDDELAKAERRVEELRAKKAALASVGASGTIDIDGIYEEIKRRLLSDSAVLMKIKAEQSRMEIAYELPVLKVSGDTVQGRLAILVAQGFFDKGANGYTAYLELVRLGAKVARVSAYREMDALSLLGFVTKERSGKNVAYLTTEGAKDRIKIVKPSKE